ncbi:MAG TPA: hypothetical protein VGV68_00250 [Terriglobia bacterium]|nr:hypothetical protein [Terriglobia bacterium]
MLKRNIIWSFLALILILATVPFGFGRGKRSSSNDAGSVRAGTKLSAQLESAVDAKTAKPGDEVVARVTQNIKQNGKVVVRKGDRLMGHVTNVRSAANAHEGSQMTVNFDRLVSGESTTQLNAVVSAVLSTPGMGSASNDAMPMMEPDSGPMVGGGGRRSGGGGGLLGGATAGVGSTVGAVGSTAGNLGGTVGGAAQTTVSSATRAGLSTPAKMIHINSGAQADSSAGLASALSTRQGNLRLDSGTRLEFRVAAQGNAQVK